MRPPSNHDRQISELRARRLSRGHAKPPASGRDTRAYYPIHAHPAPGSGGRRVLTVCSCLAGISVMVLLFAMGFRSRSLEEAGANALMTGPAAPARAVNITLNKMVSSAHVSRQDLFNVRKQVLQAAPGVLFQPYVPNPRVFRLVRDEAPWWSAAGLYFFGKSAVMPDGVPAHALGLANPLLLILPRFRVLSAEGGLQWIKTGAEDAFLVNGDDFPLYPRPDSLTFYPREGRLELEYNLSAHLEKLRPWVIKLPKTPAFGIDTYNAFDMNYRFLYLSLSDSVNIRADRDPKAAVPAFAMFGYSPSACGNTGGCNELLTRLSFYQNVEISALPARAVFKLWRGPLPAPGAREDLIFAISFQ